MRRISLLLQQIILHSLSKIKEERTVNSIYHLLTGKQSIQTIQDAHLFNLEAFFSLYKPLPLSQFNEQLSNLIEENYIQQSDTNKYELTISGKEFLEAANLDRFYWNGMAYRQVDDEFSKRLLLMIQVWTNRQAKINQYIPIIEDWPTTNWAKQFYVQEGREVTALLQQVYESLVAIFSKLEAIYPQLFIKQMTTASSIGLTYEQLAQYFRQSPTTIFLLEKNYIHFMLKTIRESEGEYELLKRMMAGLKAPEQTHTVTTSAQVTKRLVDKGLTLEEIAFKRKLKMTTIYDHIVEIALYDKSFPIDRFISPEEKSIIFNIVKEKQSYKLKAIKERVGDDISYFQIRLALTQIERLSHDEVNDD